MPIPIFTYFVLMKILFFLPIFLVAFSLNAQQKVERTVANSLNARIAVGGKSGKLLLDSLFSAYQKTPFQIYEDSNRYESGSTYLYNGYKRLKAQSPKICKDCEKKMQVLRDLSEQETKAAMDLQYNKILIKADEMFLKGELARSKELYMRALTFKPSDAAPKDALLYLEEIDSKGFEYYRYSKQEINRMVKYADGAFVKKDFVTAKFWYARILTFDPNMQYAADKIVEIDAKLRSIQQMEQNEK